MPESPRTEQLEQWHVIQGKELIRLLYRASVGEEPDMLYLELLANSRPGGGQGPA